MPFASQGRAGVSMSLGRSAARGKRIIIGFVVGAALAIPSTAVAYDSDTITSPSGWNHCHWYYAIPYAAYREAGVVCTSTSGPEAGYAVVLTASGRRWTGYAAHRWIFGAGPRLYYGYSRSRFGIVCSSRITGLRCVQLSSDHGIFVSTQLHGYFSSYSPGSIVPQ
jgi:hypothetical protein